MLRVPLQGLKALRRTAMLSVLPLVVAGPAFAGTSPPAPTPPTPPPTITSTPQVTTGATCAQQYNNEINRLTDVANTAADDALIANITANSAAFAIFGLNEAIAFANGTSFGVMSGGLAAAGAGAVTALVITGAAAPGLVTAGVAAGTLAGFGFADALSIAFQIGEFAAAGVALGFDGTANTANTAAAVLTRDASGLPFCDLTFTGTVKVDAGGLNVTGVSIFNSNVGIDGDLDISGNFSASQVNTAQGISAHNGRIFLGDPDGVTFQDGITLGGGALSGAGFGRPLAFTGDPDAIAIGNGASAASVNGTALGTGANASGIGGTALGANSAATTGVSVGLGATTTTGVSIGNGAGLAGDAGVAVGTGARAREASDAAFGNGATVNAINGAAFGTGATISSLSDNGVAFGQSTTIGGVNAVGSDNVTAVGRNIDIVDGVDNAVALGTEANVLADGGIAIGQASAANAIDSIAIGRGVTTVGERGIGIGIGAAASGTDTIAIGTGATATASIAIGNVAAAFGNGANANFANSAAFGNLATVTRVNQQVFGIVTNTYTMPGITSPASRSAQSGLLELPTTDAGGNLASDGGAVFNAIARLQAGVAVAMAMESPELATGERFGIRVGWGGFDSFQSDANAVGVSAIGVLGRNLFSDHDRLALDVGAGWGYSEFMDYKQSGVLAGRAGLQLTW